MEGIKKMSGISYSFPLRPNFMVQIVLPKDLSSLEIKRLKAFLETLECQPDAKEEKSETELN